MVNNRRAISKGIVATDGFDGGSLEFKYGREVRPSLVEFNNGQGNILLTHKNGTTHLSAEDIQDIVRLLAHYEKHGVTTFEDESEESETNEQSVEQ